MFERDPEDLYESYEDVELRMDSQDSMHEFDPDPLTGKCRGYLIRHGMQGRPCGSRQAYSVFHYDDRSYCCYLSEQGIDCGHGEEYYD